jgi:nucleotide-binding universal stress UspA family protein
VQTLSLEGDPAKEILKLAGKNSKIEMIVLGTHGRSGWSRVLLGSVAEEVIRHSSIPVMSVGPNAQKMASKFLKSSPVKILIPTSLSLNSKRAENYGLDLAQRLGAQVIFFHSMQDALEPLLRVSFSKPHSVPAIREYIEDTKVLLLKQLAQRVQVANKIGVTASGVLDDETFSASASILKQLSRSKSSFIVMGTHGRSLATGFFFGRTAREMILNSPTPIVTIQSKSE